MTRHGTSPQYVQEIVAHASEVPCEDCGAAPGVPCTRPGPGRSVCKLRYIQSSIMLRRQARAQWQTPEQQAELEAVLAALPRVPKAEIEACRTSAGGYRFTREKLASWGVPWPPPAGWRKALERDEEPTE